jgi:transcriptional regulator with XRE-family HTH domain
MRARRKILGLSQEKLAEMVDVSTQTINDIECCRSWVSDRTLSNVAAALGFEVFQLFVPNETQEEGQEEPIMLTAALVQLRQDVTADLCAYVESSLNKRFSRFLSAELSAPETKKP